jgi:DNA polymerase-3 subunit delta'
MDTVKSSARIKKTAASDNNQIAPAYAWVGPHATVLNHTYRYLQSIFCTHNGCGNCTSCTQISTQQHHAITWLYPDKKYTLEQLDIIFNTIALSVDTNTHHFFVIQKADALTTTCANRLLKPIEEPPAGYHFLLLAERKDGLLPTIRSRCIIENFSAAYGESPFKELYECFVTKKFISPIFFTQILSKETPNERESAELVDSLLTYWLDQYKKSIVKQQEDAQQHAYTMVNYLKNAMQQLPMPGSSKLFWKNLFLQMNG